MGIDWRIVGLLMRFVHARGIEGTAQMFVESLNILLYCILFELHTLPRVKLICISLCSTVHLCLLFHTFYLPPTRTQSSTYPSLQPKLIAIIERLRHSAHYNVRQKYETR